MSKAQPSAAVLAVDAHLHTHRYELEDFIGELVGINSQIPPFDDERLIAASSPTQRSGLACPTATSSPATPIGLTC
jgi:hypothetical protein